MKYFLIGICFWLIFCAWSWTTNIKRINNEDDLYRYKDPDYKVTCWVYKTGSFEGRLSCLPENTFVKR